jgi:hypothetical protein
MTPFPDQIEVTYMFYDGFAISLGPSYTTIVE